VGKIFNTLYVIKNILGEKLRSSPKVPAMKNVNILKYREEEILKMGK
jgi:hypothetical protein